MFVLRYISIVHDADDFIFIIVYIKYHGLSSQRLFCDLFGNFLK